MSRVLQVFTSVVCAVVAAFISGCSTEEVREHQAKRTDSYLNYQERRQIRSQARQQRTDAWYNRIMGNPVKTDDTGLKIPQ